MPIKNKYVFVGDTNSINIEIILKSAPYLEKKVNYILIGNIRDIQKYMQKIKFKLSINEIINPLDFRECKSKFINIFNIDNVSQKKYQNIINQIKISNHLSSLTKFDLITMPINKSLFKKKIKFTGMTEYLGIINNKKTIMLMYGEKFSVIPFTTHINLGSIKKNLNIKKLNDFLKLLLVLIKEKKYRLNFKHLIFLCYNPHCSEDGTIGNEDKLISNSIKKFKKIMGPYPADSAFNNFEKGSLYISTYHDQCLIPFKILNNKGINITLGLNYRRLSPSHGTAVDKKFKNMSNNSSYLACMQI